MLKRFLLIILLLSSLPSLSQYYNDGQDRAGIKWKKIGSVNFEVIFPEGFEIQAERVVKLMEKSYEYTTITLKHRPKKISIILHTETVKSNAFLGWAPSRIEMYTTPHQNIYSQDWLEQLAIHEYRHMVQVSKLESEMPKLFRILFGEQAAAALTAAYLPFWFIEGDAVAAETGLGKVGRGRTSDFHRELRTQVIEKGIYSYDKAYLGSYKDHVANHYHLGYFMVGGARTLFDKTIWEDVLHNVARKPLSLKPFDNGLRKSIGLNKVELYDTVFQYLKKMWTIQDQNIVPTQFQPISKLNKYHTDYRFVFPITDSTYFAEKNSQSDINRFVIFTNTGDEQRIFTPGYHFNESVSGKKNTLVWIERLSHPRWYHADLSLLRIYNIEENKLNEFKFNTKLFAPAFSPDLKHIVAVEVDNNYRFFLVLINAESGIIVDRFSTPENDFFITPSWATNGENILVIGLRNNEKSILQINVKTRAVTEVLAYGTQEISRPVEYNGNVFFIGGYTGIDNLYVIKSDGRIGEMISSRFGIADHAYNNNQIIYTNYTSNGYQVVKTDMDSVKFNPVHLPSLQQPYPIANAISKQEKGTIDFTKLDDMQYQSEPYKKGEHLLNFHSWAPLSIDPISQSVNSGVSIMSQNMLSTAELMAGYRYRWQDEQGEIYANFKYYGWYPVLEAEFNSGKRESYYYELKQFINSNNEIIRVDTLKKDFTWHETNVMLNCYAPINLSKGNYYRKIQPRLKYRFSNISADNRANEVFPDGIYQSIETGVYLYQIMQSSEQDVLPNFGFMLDLAYVKSLSGVVDFGSLFSVSNIFYLPGIRPNHGITLYNGYQIKESKEYAFNDRIRLPRGHRHILNDRLYSFGSDYELPLFYSDLSIWNLAFLKRFKLKLFYDFAFYSGSTIIDKIKWDYNGDIKSTGFELTADTHILRFIAPIELGFRTSYMFNNQLSVDFLFNIEFTF